MKTLSVFLLFLAACGGGGGGSSTTGTPTSTAPFLNTIVLLAPAGNVAVGSTLQLSASPVDQFGSPFTTTLNWISANTAAATVSSSGLVSGVANGISVITAASGNTQNSVTVGVGNAGGQFPLNGLVQATADRQFVPATVTVQAGGTVQWGFVGVQHTVTFSVQSPASIPATSSGLVARSFPDAGNYTYQCTIHPEMTGTVVVR